MDEGLGTSGGGGGDDDETVDAADETVVVGATATGVKIEAAATDGTAAAGAAT